MEEMEKMRLAEETTMMILMEEIETTISKEMKEMTR